MYGHGWVVDKIDGGPWLRIGGMSDDQRLGAKVSVQRTRVGDLRIRVEGRHRWENWDDVEGLDGQ